MTLLVPEAYLEIRVEVAKESVETLCDFIIENITSGIVLEEEEDASKTVVIFYVLENNTEYRTQLTQFLAHRIPEVLSEDSAIVERQVENADWNEKYRESVRPFRVTNDLLVRPPWSSPTDDKFQLIVEPRLAFGTGSHPTTRSCLRIIRENFESGMRFLDIGCGSGILSILADQMGAIYIKAVDYDPAATINCRENFAINEVRSPHDILIGSMEQCAQDEAYQFVNANIIKDTILEMLDDLLLVTDKAGILVLSGLLKKDEHIVSQALVERGQEDFSIRRDEEWSSYILRKK